VHARWSAAASSIREYVAGGHGVLGTGSDADVGSPLAVEVHAARGVVAAALSLRLRRGVVQARGMSTMTCFASSGCHTIGVYRVSRCAGVFALQRGVCGVVVCVGGSAFGCGDNSGGQLLPTDSAPSHAYLHRLLLPFKVRPVRRGVCVFIV
jgi:hypothetical protein